uniref:mTERF domain-containing protein, mitochondrial n=1 Tax=Aureoumbra lagunensis TaxID=44058 RepID=A0A7S3JTN4_9STRA|mmetsp:Transcript_4015/g.6164  ORF Transcript_4015/g.6164 Transcript_4015/m.6164 type:complete len:587 (-) Transcript_4015:1463-3223(-)
MSRIRCILLIFALLRICATFSPSDSNRKYHQRKISLFCTVELREILLEGGASETEVTEMAMKLGSIPGESIIEGAYLAAEALTKRGFSGGEIATILGQSPRQLCAPGAVDDIAASLDFLSEEAGLKNRELRRIAKLRPQILVKKPKLSVFRDTGACPAVLATVAGGPIFNIRNSTCSPVDIIRDIIFFLQGVGFRDRRIKELLVRWPQILTIEMPQLLAVTDFLSSNVGFSTPALREKYPQFYQNTAPLSALYRQAPWLLAASVGSQLRPVTNFLRHDAGVQRLDIVISAFPRCFLLDPDRELRPRLYALKKYGVTEPGKIIETFPLVLGLDVSEQTDPVIHFWLNEIGIHRDDIPKICRAFPSLLGVDVQTMQKSIDFLREIGVQNIARFVTRLPPVLAYDVESILRPKMTFAVQNALSIYDVVRFPAYFSYPLDQVIEPRAAFLQRHRPIDHKSSDAFKTAKRVTQNKSTKRPSYTYYSNTPIPLASIGLSRVLTPSDDAFAKLANASPQEYAKFKQRFLQQRQQSTSLSATKNAAATVERKENTLSFSDSLNKRRAISSSSSSSTSSSDSSSLPFPPLLRFPQ